MPSFTAAVFASSLAASAYAAGHNQHANLHMKRGASGAWSEPAESATPSEQCGCTTYTTTWYGEPTLVDDWDYSKEKTSVAAAAAAMPTSSDDKDTTTTVLRTVSVAPLQSSSDATDTTTTVYTTVDMASLPSSSYAVDTTTVPTTVLTTETLMTTETVQATTYITGSPDNDSTTHMTTTKTIDSTVTVPYTKKLRVAILYLGRTVKLFVMGGFFKLHLDSPVFLFQLGTRVHFLQLDAFQLHLGTRELLYLGSAILFLGGYKL
ncbi:hypothetical protein BTJ68_07383 [Hortaea werneckii EXF-2000]|uniref:Uncharacterized protein n=1 Tax=Hortaea werneckii EXF-2000 TaxID=1157616 RepID=A0A1Z5TBK7_HORWE|nr:hypothetical protein BTJ68_07383 [Hortaea werneckii EXF-2000]